MVKFKFEISRSFMQISPINWIFSPRCIICYKVPQLVPWLYAVLLIFGLNKVGRVQTPKLLILHIHRSTPSQQKLMQVLDPSFYTKIRSKNFQRMLLVFVELISIAIVWEIELVYMQLQDLKENNQAHWWKQLLLA